MKQSGQRITLALIALAVVASLLIGIGSMAR